MNELLILIHWPHYGKYHHARFIASTDRVGNLGYKIIGLEITDSEGGYLWGNDEKRSPGVNTLFKNTSYGRINPLRVSIGLYRFLQKKSPDIIFINGYSTIDAWVLVLWCKFKHIPAILMSESQKTDSLRRSRKEAIKTRIIMAYSAALCGGSRQKRYLETLGMPAERIFLGYDAIDNMFFQDQAKIVQNNSTSWIGLPGLENEPPYFLASARFIRRKNILGLLEAYHQYTKQVVFKGSKPWRLIVLGDGEDKPEITNLIKNLSLDGVTLAGIQPYEILPVYYGYASAFIHPALQDQWGLVVNEAMATGLPVLVSKQSGCAEDLVLDGVNGFQFDARNPTELAELMVKFSQGEFDCQQMGKESQRIISQWGLDRFANGLLAAVEAVL